MNDVAPICAKCQHLYIVNKNDLWYRWLCMQMPREAEYNPVLGVTVADPPYYRCKDINTGNCHLYEHGPNSLEPRRIEHESQ